MLLISLTFGLLIAYITGTLLWIAVSYKRLDFYRKQGLQPIFNPVVGFLKYFMLKNGSKDQLEALKELYSENSNESLLVFNSLNASSSLVLLMGRDIITEFYNKEFKISKKLPFADTQNAGFLDYSGDDALKKRAIFKQFFH